MASFPSSSVVVLNTPTSAMGAAGSPTDAQKLEETNLLLRAMVILLCNMTDVNYDDIISLAGGTGSALSLKA